MSEEIEMINSFGLSSISALIGYSVIKNDVFSFTPLVGGGYLGHIVDTGEYAIFFDPQITIQTEVNFTILENLYIFFTPGFIIFFEESITGSFFCVNLGIKKAFYIGVGEKEPKPTLPGLPRIIIERSIPSFSPNGDGNKDTLALSLEVDKNIPVSSCEMRILNRNNKPVKDFSGRSVLSERFIWDGKDNNGKSVSDGIYSAAFPVKYEDGRELKVHSDSFIVDSTAPKVRLDITPDIFSPDNDGDKDKLTIRYKVEDGSKVADSRGKIFKSFKGKGDFPKQLVWDGKSDRGELVQSAEDYPLTFVVVDEVGNEAIVNDVIKTDILV